MLNLNNTSVKQNGLHTKEQMSNCFPMNKPSYFRNSFRLSGGGHLRILRTGLVVIEYIQNLFSESEIYIVREPNWRSYTITSALEICKTCSDSQRFEMKSKGTWNETRILRGKGDTFSRFYIFFIRDTVFSETWKQFNFINWDFYFNSWVYLLVWRGRQLTY